MNVETYSYAKGKAPPTDQLGNQLGEGTLDDLQLAEVNYICIKASIDQGDAAARQNMFTHCLDHIEALFKKGSYAEAINTTFVTQGSDFSWTMIGIFCGVFVVLFISAYLICRLIKNRREEKSRKRRGGHNRNQQVQNHTESYDNERSSTLQGSSVVHKEYRVPRARARVNSISAAAQKRAYGASSVGFGEFDKASDINVPLLDYSEDASDSQEARSSK